MKNLKNLALSGIAVGALAYSGLVNKTTDISNYVHNKFNKGIQESNHLNRNYSNSKNLTNKLSAQENSKAYNPLDLPSGGLGDDEDEENAPEVIHFYGNDFEGEGFFWCLDTSGSMDWGNRIEVLKHEVSSAIQQLSGRAEFSLVRYSTTTVPWSFTPKAANPGNKASANAWIQSMNAVGWTCLEHAGVTTVNISNLSSKQNKKIMIVGDGVPLCNNVNTEQACLSSITSANWQHSPVDTIYISTDAAGINFMQQLANMNNGTAYIVQQ